MHIAIFIDQMARVGGSERVAANLCQAWSEDGAKVTLITLNPGTEGIVIPSEIVRRSLSSKPKRSGLTGLFDSVINGFRLGRAMREAKPDMVVAISTVASLQLAFARCAPGTIKFGSEHGYMRHYRQPSYIMLARRLLYPSLDAVVCPALRSAQAIAEDCPGTKALAVPNPLTLPLPASGPAISTDQFIKPSRRYFCTSARLDPLKRIDQLIEAFALVNEKLLDWDLIILGDGPLRIELESKVKALELGARVLFVGWVGNPAQWYERTDIFVFSSHSEGFGMVLAEAMAYGLPCITYDCDAGPADIVRDGIDGVVVPLGDIPALANQMRCLALDSGRRAEFSQRARDVIDRFGNEAVLGRWQELIRSAKLLQGGQVNRTR
ncbi:MAG: glycosyltransferase family 4 protein [Opitutaceae bacterium]